MSRIVAKQGIPRFRLRHQRLIGGYNVIFGRLRVPIRIQQDRNVLLFKTVHILDVFQHIPHIIVAAR